MMFSALNAYVSSRDMVNNKTIVVKVLNYITFLNVINVFNKGENIIADGSFIDYTENSELLQERIGYNISLQCNIKGLVDKNKTNDTIYYWYFKQCGENSGGVFNCYNTVQDEQWIQLPCEDNICESKLQLKNVTAKYSGLYKCNAVMPKLDNLLDVIFVKTFQLDVENISIKIPKFLDAYSLNKTASIGSQAVFQCRIFSEECPTIKWFRRLPSFKYGSYENIHSTTMIYYNGLAYKLLTSAHKKPNPHNVYISKLILNKVRLQDEGYYACVANSFRGYNIQEAYLKVYVPDDEYWMDYEEEDTIIYTDSKKFSMLFLIPVGLAILPLSVWFYYIIHKRCTYNNLKDEAKYPVEYLAPPDQ